MYGKTIVPISNIEVKCSILVLRNKKKPTAPRPHTVHLEGGGDGPVPPSDKTINLSRTRTYSDPAETEQDENKPPVESVSCCFIRLLLKFLQIFIINCCSQFFEKDF